MQAYEIKPVGDQALSVNFLNEINPKINQRLQFLAKKILERKIHEVKTVIPAYHTLLVKFDGLASSFQDIANIIKPIVDQSLEQNLPASKIWQIPVCYDPKFGPDLQDVAEFGHVSVSEAIRLHTQRSYLIYFLGFLPGFAYMAGVNAKISMPRLNHPRLEIPAGSVGIAGSQTGFYPVISPGGWRLIGQTPLKLYHSEAPKFFYQPGDRVQFVPIDLEQYQEIKAADQAGNYRVKAVMKDE